MDRIVESRKKFGHLIVGGTACGMLGWFFSETLVDKFQEKFKCNGENFGWLHRMMLKELSTYPQACTRKNL